MGADVFTPGYDDTQQGKRLRQFDEIVEAARELFNEKNTKYGDAFAQSGALGCIAEVRGITKRLHTVTFAPVVTCQEEAIVEFSGARTLPTRAKRDEVARECSRDLLNYAIMIAMCLEDDNWTGDV